MEKVFRTRLEMVEGVQKPDESAQVYQIQLNLDAAVGRGRRTTIENGVAIDVGGFTQNRTRIQLGQYSLPSPQQSGQQYG